MTCAGCGFEALPDFAFCPKCGRKLHEASPAAVIEAPPPPPEPEPEADRRPVTVLFADVSGFTALGERLDPEDVRAFQTDLIAEMTAAVEAYEGFVEKFVGDAVMAVFGAPVAHEDDPERALHAALSMHVRVEALSGRWMSRTGRPIALHIGVNTGRVVAGRLGSGASAAYAVTGDTVNTAARLQSAAGPRNTLVSDATRQRAQHAFAFEPLGEMTFKGKAEPVGVHRLLHALDTPTSARGLGAHGLAAPLIGRAAELVTLLDAFDRVRAGRASVVSLVGDAGSGKSRLQAEFFARLDETGRLAGTTVLRAACSSLGEQAYGVLAAILRDAYGVMPGDTLETARDKLASGLRALGTDDAEATAIATVAGEVLGLDPGRRAREVEPEQVERQIFLAGRAIVERRLQQGPLVLVVEDLHWADAASVKLLRFLIERFHDRPLMLLVTARPAADPLAVDSVPHTIIRLAPLSAAESEAMLAAFFGTSWPRLPSRLCDLVVARAGGNPFYLEEIVRGLLASGVLVRREDGWAAGADVDTVDVPPTIRGLLLARVDRLPAGPRRRLQEAAVLGTTFDDGVLRRLSTERPALDAELRVLCDAELLAVARRRADEPDVAPAYRFTHALVQEVVYESLLVRRRAELHARTARALETLCGATPDRLEDIEALGHHLSLGGERVRGARYLTDAGDRARAIYANDDAVRHFTRALATLATLATLDGCDVDADRAALHERLGDLHAQMGRRETALEHYAAVAARCRAIDDRAGQARIHRKRGVLAWFAGDRDGAVASYEAGLALVDGSASHVELAHLSQEMGRLAFRTGDNAGAIQWAERALAAATQLASTSAAPPPAGASAARRDEQREIAGATVHAHNTLGVALARTGRLAEAVARIEDSVAVAEAHDLLQAACRGYTNLGVLYSTLDPARAIETCRQGLETAKRIGDLGLQSRLYANLAVAYCALTNRCEDQGVAAAQLAIDLDRRLGQVDHLAVPMIVLGQIYQCHGEPARALEYYRDALVIADQVGDPQLLFPCYDGLATLHLDLGDEVEAERYMMKAQQVCERSGLEPDSLVVLPFLT